MNVAASFGNRQDFPGTLDAFSDVTEMGFGWYSDWRMAIDPPRPAGIEYAQMLLTKRWPPRWDDVERVAQANPGALWMVGNEPETRGQGQHTPEEYAEIYYEAYTFLKRVDPTAQVAIGGVVMPSPLRLKWLDRCWAHYEATYGAKMPVDVWNIHMQILLEKRADWGCGIPEGLLEHSGRLYEIQDNCSVPIFEQLIWEFRTWMFARGEGDKPLIISEYGVLMPSSYLDGRDEDVLAFMEGTFTFLLTARDPVLGCPSDGGRLVQRWMWFSLNFPFHDRTPGGFNGALYNWQNPAEKTRFGSMFQDYVRSVAENEALVPSTADAYADARQPSLRTGQRGRLKVRGGSNPASALMRFDLDGLPAEAVVTRAELRMAVVANSNPQAFSAVVRPVTVEWDETTQSRDMAIEEVPPEAAATIVLAPNADLVCDVTALVRAWHEGDMANLGLRIDTEGMPPSGNATYSLAAREWVEGPQHGPELWVEYLLLPSTP